MKRIGRFLTKLMGVGVGLAAASFLLSAQAAQGTARVQSIRLGAAEYSDDGATWKKLSIGTVLKAGQSVRTDAKAIVDLYLRLNGPVVRVTPDTTLALTTLTFEQADQEAVITTELNLSNGRILGNVKKLAAASKYEVKTPVGSCGIRGTTFDIAMNGRCTVIDGTVVMLYTPPGKTTPTTFVVQMGQTFEPTANNGEGAVVPTPKAAADAGEKQKTEMVRVVTQAEITVVQVVAPPPIRDINQPPISDPTLTSVEGQGER